MIAFENVWHHHGLKPTLRGVSFEAEAGKLTRVMGENGVAGTTPVRIAAGIAAFLQTLLFPGFARWAHAGPRRLEKWLKRTPPKPIERVRLVTR